MSAALAFVQGAPRKPRDDTDSYRGRDQRIDRALYNFVNDEAIPGSGIQARKFWKGLAGLVRELTPRNAALLSKQDKLQAKIDAWHRDDPGPGFDPGQGTRKYS